LRKREHVVVFDGDRILIDRKTLATLTGRSEHTIRARCPVARRKGIRPLYDVEVCEKILADIPTRRTSAA